ncbi:suppressor of glycerol defect [Chytridiales sp. JEL 0842]|nr:suppressor of glycerol defect [Chytridiales sp. JEL 0842]
MVDSTVTFSIVTAVIAICGLPILATLKVTLNYVISSTFYQSLLRPLTGKHILITGASKGLGKALAIVLARAGANVTIVARSESLLEQVATECRTAASRSKFAKEGTIMAVPCDLSCYTSTLRSFRMIYKTQGTPYWIIANAGGAHPGFLANQLDPLNSEVEVMMRVNYFTAVNVVRAMLAMAKGYEHPELSSGDGKKKMAEEREEVGTLAEAEVAVDVSPAGGMSTLGHVDEAVGISGLNHEHVERLPKRLMLVGSTLSLMSFLGYSAYSASKYAVKGLADSLRSELKSVGVKVQIFCPSNMNTEGHIIENITKPTITAKLEGTAGLVTASEAANAMLAGAMRGRYCVTNDLLTEYIRVVTNGATPRPNPLTEFMALPLLSFIFEMWVHIADSDVAGFFKKVTKNTVGGGGRGGARLFQSSRNGSSSHPGRHSNKSKDKGDTTTLLPSALSEELADFKGSSLFQPRDQAALSNSSKKKKKGGAKNAVVDERQAAFEGDRDAREQQESEKRFKFKYDKKILKRKDLRKKAKEEKKKRVVEFHAHRFDHKKAAEMDDTEKVAGNKRKSPEDAKSSEPSSKKSKTTNSSSPTKDTPLPLSKKPTTTTKKTSATSSGPTAAQLARFKESNPGLYRMLIEQNLAPSDGSAPIPTRTQEDDDIEYYSKKLGLKKGQNIKNAMKADGLDELWEELGNGFGEGGEGDLKAYTESKRKAKKEKEGKKEGSVVKKKEEGGEETFRSYASDEEDDLFADLNMDDEDGDDDDEDLDLGDFDDDDDEDLDLGDFDDDNDEEEEEEGVDGDESDELESGNVVDSDDNEEGDEEDDDEDAKTLSGIEDSEEDEDDEVDNDKNEEHSKENTADATSTSPPSSAPAKYVPPHLRAKPTSKSEEYLRLRRQIQGLLNRLSDANMESIILGIEDGYRKNTRHDMTEIITDLILGFISDNANLLDSFVITYAALISSLYNIIGMELGAHLVQTTVERFDSCMKELGTRDKEEDLEEVGSKKALNLATLVAHLYKFDVVSYPLVYDVVNMCLDRLKEVDVEILLRVLRVAGAKMRVDDPLSLKDVVLKVHEGVKKGEEHFQTTRVKFLVEMITDLKNNKGKLKKKGNASGSATEIQYERLKKFVGNFTNRRSQFGREALRVTLDDIRNVETKGKWWLVGAAWAGRDGQGGIGYSTPEQAAAAAAIAASEEAVQDVVQGAGVDLLALAKKQGMNTDDCVDAHHRLLKLNLKEKQEREIVRVLIHCAGAERVYNPYYALVAARFCDGPNGHGFKITFQYALWDLVKELAEDSVEDEDKGVIRKVRNLAKMYAWLVAGSYLWLTVIKTLDFTELSSMNTLFAQLFFFNLLSSPPATGKDPEKTLKDVFKQVCVSDDQEELREGISFFLTQYIAPKGPDGRPKLGMGFGEMSEETREKLAGRVKMLKRLLADGRTSAMLDGYYPSHNNPISSTDHPPKMLADMPMQERFDLFRRIIEAWIPLHHVGRPILDIFDPGAQQGSMISPLPFSSDPSNPTSIFNSSRTTGTHPLSGISSLSRSFLGKIVDVATTLGLLTEQLTTPGVSVDISTSFCSDASLGETLIIVAKSEKLGRRLGFSQASIYKKDKATGGKGKLVARGSHTKFFDVPGGSAKKGDSKL